MTRDLLAVGLDWHFPVISVMIMGLRSIQYHPGECQALYPKFGFAIVLLTAPLACKKETSKSLASNAQAVASGRLLEKALAALPELDWQAQLDTSKVSQDQFYDSAISTDVLEAFDLSRQKRTFVAGEKVFRQTRYQLNSGLSPFQISLPDTQLQFPLKMSAGGEVVIVKTFGSLAEARSAPILAPHDWPLSAEKALNLPDYSYVAFPVEGALATEANGQFLARAWDWGQKLRSFVSLSGASALSATASGTLTATGHWLLEISKLTGHDVRARLRRHRSLEAQLSAAASASANGSYRFSPYDRVEQVLDIKERYFTRYDTTAEKIKKLVDKVHLQRLLLPDRLAKVEALVANQSRPELAELVNQLHGKRDELLSLVNFADDSLQNLQNKIAKPLTVKVTALEKAITGKLAPVSDRLERLSRRAIATAVAIRLDASFGSAVSHMNDYMFDLSSEEAAHAFEQAVSGRAVWLASHADALTNQTQMLNFAVADRLADSGVAAVRRVGSYLRKSEDKALKLSLAGLGASTGFNESWRANEVIVKLPSGALEAWHSSLWSFERNMNLFGQSSRDFIASGYLVSAAGQIQQNVGSYWFRLARTEPASFELASGLNETLNLVGSIGFLSGLAKLSFDPEAPIFGYDLLVGLKPSGVNLLFDQQKVDDTILWQTLARVVEGFDNRFGLPYNTLGGRPEVTEANPAAAAACDLVAKEWGGAYCGFFAEKVFAKIASLRSSTDSFKRMQAFEEFYQAGFLANKIGARLLLRFIMELLYFVEGDAALDHLTLRFQTTNTENPAAQLSNVYMETGADRSSEVMAAFGLIE